jgi:hypothetical protein
MAFNIPILKRFPLWYSYRPDSFPLLALRMLRRRFAIDSDRVVLMGYSMGGFGTWNIGLRYHDRFAAAAPLAGGVSREEFVLLRDKRSRTLLGNASTLPLFFVHGDEDQVVPVKFDRLSADDLTRLGHLFLYEEVKGGKHVLTQFLAGDALRDKLAAWIADAERDPHPRRVEHHAIGAYHGSAYWLRIDALTGDRARVVAVTKKNVIQVVASGVKSLTLFLDPELVKVKKRVTVIVNGKRLFKNKVKPSLDVVAETFARAGDPELTFAHALTLDLPQNLPEPKAGDWRLGR